MLCAPPMCQPATHFLGCFSLKTGAKVVLVLDGLYGLTLVFVHSLLLGEVKEPESEMHRLDEMRSLKRRLEEEEGGSAGREAAEAMAEDQKTAWWLQFMDLDFGFGHQLLGLPDQTNIVTGLIYGVIVTGVAFYVLQAIQSKSPTLAQTARWFTSFAHLQILLYTFIQLIKWPKLCKVIQKEYLTHLYMECHVLWFIYFGRTSIYIILFSFSTWIFASFSFVLTFGHGAHAAVDRPEYSTALDMGMPPPGTGSKLPPGGGGPGGGGGGYPPRGAMGSFAPGSRRGGLVGDPVTTYPPQGYSHTGSHVQPPPSRHPMAGGGSHHGTSYNIGRNNMPRATSSMATSASGYSQEHHPLIKPPVAVY